MHASQIILVEPIGMQHFIRTLSMLVEKDIIREIYGYGDHSMSPRRQAIT
jgi:hypothetical protein